MNPAQQRALFVGAMLHSVNVQRDGRAAVAGSWPEGNPGGLAVYLVDSAHLDELRRRLRPLLQRALLDCPLAGPRHAPPSWRLRPVGPERTTDYRGRHARR